MGREEILVAVLPKNGAHFDHQIGFELLAKGVAVLPKNGAHFDTADLTYKPSEESQSYLKMERTLTCKGIFSRIHWLSQSYLKMERTLT